MSGIGKCITIAGGVTAGLFSAALVSSATVSADTALPVIPGLGGVIERVLNAPATIPQQLLQTTSALTGTGMTPPSSPAPGLTANVNLPQMPMAVPSGTPAGSPSLPGNLSPMLPFAIPGLGGATAPAAAPTAAFPGTVFPAVPVTSPAPATVQLIPGLP